MLIITPRALVFLHVAVASESFGEGYFTAEFCIRCQLIDCLKDMNTALFRASFRPRSEKPGEST